jgi:hypothetical protein
MYLEAFTAGKDPRRPEANEDRLVIVAGSAYAVVDGVTDKTGRTYDGLTGGQLAGALIEDALRELVATHPFMSVPASEIVALINARFRAAYAHRGIAERVRDDPNERFAAQLALALSDHRAVRFVLVGDCGLRLDGVTTYLLHHPGDAITAAMRAIVYHALEGGADEAQRLAVARAYALDGMAAFLSAYGESIDERSWSALRTRLDVELAERYREVPRSVVEAIVATGVKGLARYRNATSPLAFASIDGTDVPEDLIRDFSLPRSAIGTIELFSDGYFRIPDGTTVRHWEDAFHLLELEDPAKVTTVLSTKGSGGGLFTDDRTVMIIRGDPLPHA